MIIEAMQRRKLPYMVSAGRIQTLLTCAKAQEWRTMLPDGFSVCYIRLGTGLLSAGLIIVKCVQFAVMCIRHTLISMGSLRVCTAIVYT